MCHREVHSGANWFRPTSSLGNSGPLSMHEPNLNSPPNGQRDSKSPRRDKNKFPLSWIISGFLLALLIVAVPVFWFGSKSEVFPVSAEAHAQPQSSAQSGPGRISGMSASQAGATTIVAIRLDRAMNYRVFSLSQPSPRLVIDLPRVTFGLGNGQAGTVNGSGGVNSFRFAQKSNTESRIVIDLKSPMRVQKQEIVNVLGGRSLRLELVPTTAEVFAKAAPPPKVATTSASLPVPAPLKQGQNGRRFVIVIDPGHGGKDPGASGVEGQLIEKDVTLASAIALRDLLRRDRRFEVILTRDTDVFLTLERRILTARDRRADLFISLHADAAPPTARVNGATVYTLSEEGGQRARRLLNNDNWSIAPSNRTQDQSVLDILRDLTQRDTKNQSAVFGQGLIDQIRRIGPVTATSHRRAGFFVLLSPRVPAVLLEMGFLTNAEDAARLGDPAFRGRQMGGAARAISSYFDRLQVVSGSGQARP
jgi:N-acetylmuramoyl-L-alanine amidase